MVATASLAVSSAHGEPAIHLEGRVPVTVEQLATAIRLRLPTTTAKITVERAGEGQLAITANGVTRIVQISGSAEETARVIALVLSDVLLPSARARSVPTAPSSDATVTSPTKPVSSPATDRPSSITAPKGGSDEKTARRARTSTQKAPGTTKRVIRNPRSRTTRTLRLMVGPTVSWGRAAAAPTLFGLAGSGIMSHGSWLAFAGAEWQAKQHDPNATIDEPFELRLRQLSFRLGVGRRVGAFELLGHVSLGQAHVNLATPNAALRESATKWRPGVGLRVQAPLRLVGPLSVTIAAHAETWNDNVSVAPDVTPPDVFPTVSTHKMSFGLSAAFAVDKVL